MIAAALALVLAGAPKLELGGFGGLGYLYGDPQTAKAREASVADAVRYPWTFGGWFGYQWIRGSQIGLRYQQWYAKDYVTGLDDFGGGKESLELQVYGLEFVELLPVGQTTLRLGGGFGFAHATDILESYDESISAKGDGGAMWLRAGMALPVGSATLHGSLSGTYASLSRMKSYDLGTYKTSYLLFSGEIGMSFGL